MLLNSGCLSFFSWEQNLAEGLGLMEIIPRGPIAKDRKMREGRRKGQYRVALSELPSCELWKGHRIVYLKDGKLGHLSTHCCLLLVENCPRITQFSHFQDAIGWWLRGFPRIWRQLWGRKGKEIQCSLEMGCRSAVYTCAELSTMTVPEVRDRISQVPLPRQAFSNFLWQ